ncbi:lipid kinase YegS [Chiayiivirga flava]|uniref:Probable lipid kinase YegS-like n=1 Tax=Chiayiivirga flava TaxID=659595 RepID=A0A7W8D8A6_9GAMM|nr:lipid kinase YegS [Chiayiivirga flava]MBB5209710.1 lipid kinase YegS [Chiayiivirga flava]
MTTSLRLILNGKSAGDEAVRAAVLAERQRGTAIDVRVTWEHGDAARYVAEAIDDGIGTLVAAGGDGTVNEVCTALAATERGADALPAVGLLPLGTANDFATACGIPDEPDAALALLRAAPAVPVDLLRVTIDGGPPRWCVNVATGGFGAEVTAETDPALKKALGGAAYFITGLTRFASMRAAAGRFRGPDFRWEGEFLVLAIANGRQAGGGHVLAPDANIDNGLFDLTIVPPPGEGGLGAVLGALLTQGREQMIENAVRARLPWLELEADAGLALNLDGEPNEVSHLRVDIAPARVRMHLPPTCPLLRGAAND